MTQILKYAVRDDEKEKVKQKCIFGCHYVCLLLCVCEGTSIIVCESIGIAVYV